MTTYAGRLSPVLAIAAALLAGCTLDFGRPARPTETTRRDPPGRDPGRPDRSSDGDWIEIRSGPFERAGVTSPPPLDVEGLTIWDAAALAQAAAEAVEGHLDEPILIAPVVNRTTSHFDMQVLASLLGDELSSAGARVLAGPHAPRSTRVLQGQLESTPDGLILELQLDDARGRARLVRERLEVDALRDASDDVAPPRVAEGELGDAVLQASADALVERLRDRERPGSSLEVLVENRSTRHLDAATAGDVLGRHVADRLGLALVEGDADLELRASILDVELPRPDGRPAGRGDRRGTRGDSQRLHLISLELVRVRSGRVLGSTCTWLAAP